MTRQHTAIFLTFTDRNFIAFTRPSSAKGLFLVVLLLVAVECSKVSYPPPIDGYHRNRIALPTVFGRWGERYFYLHYRIFSMHVTCAVFCAIWRGFFAFCFDLIGWNWSECKAMFSEHWLVGADHRHHHHHQVLDKREAFAAGNYLSIRGRRLSMCSHVCINVLAWLHFFWQREKVAKNCWIWTLYILIGNWPLRTGVDFLCVMGFIFLLADVRNEQVLSICLQFKVYNAWNRILEAD